MDRRAAILSKIERYLSASGMGANRFGKDAVGDTKLLRRMRAGGDITLTTAEKIEEFMRINPPTARNRAA